MCVASMVMDDFNRRHKVWQEPHIEPVPLISSYPVTREEFAALKKEVEALREMLKAAKIYDEATGQVDCEQEEKKALVRRIAEIVGVDLSDLL